MGASTRSPAEFLGSRWLNPKREFLSLILKRINSLNQDIQRSPLQGIGKPEPLKHGLSGYWSRRINDEHRIVYKVEGDSLLLAQLRYHY